MKNGLSKKIGLTVIPFFLALFMRLWFGTIKVRVHDEHHKTQAFVNNTAVIGVIWHYSVLAVFTLFRRYRPALMISSSNDGDYLSRMANHMGFTTVRGSSHRKGMQAARGGIAELKKGNSLGMVADGSQGPERKMQPGPIVLASKTGAVILPMIWSCNRYRTFSTWDRLMLPLPFSRIELFFGEPMKIPKGSGAEDLNVYRQQLEEQLNALYTRAWSFQGKTEH